MKHHIKKIIEIIYKVIMNPLFLILIVILFPISISALCKHGILSYNTKTIFIEYGGSILGGFLTLFGVWWTIKRQDKEQRENMYLRVRPIIVTEKIQLSFDREEDNIMTDEYGNITQIDYNYCINKIEVILKNIGSGPSKVIRVEDNIDAYFQKNLKDAKHKVDFNTPERIYYLIEPGRTFTIKFTPKNNFYITDDDIHLYFSFYMLVFDIYDNKIRYKIFSHDLIIMANGWLHDTKNLNLNTTIQQTESDKKI